MTETPDETATTEQDAPERRHYEVSILANTEAASPADAYMLVVDSLIRYGTDQFHPVIADVESGERWLLTQDGTLVTGEAMHAALLKVEAEIEAQADAAANGG